MTTAALDRDLFLPRRPAGLGRGLLLALLAHGLLIAALSLGVSWRASPPEGVEAELWAAVPQVAAPRAAEPEPPLPPPPRTSAGADAQPQTATAPAPQPTASRPIPPAIPSKVAPPGIEPRFEV